MFLILFAVWFVGAVVYYSLLHYLTSTPRTGAEEFYDTFQQLSPGISHLFIAFATVLWPVFVGFGVVSLVREKLGRGHNHS